jgi:hypothetical protein
MVPFLSLRLAINRLLPEDKRNKVKHTFNYRVDDSDLDRFEAELDAFVRVIDYARTRYENKVLYAKCKIGTRYVHGD